LTNSGGDVLNKVVELDRVKSGLKTIVDAWRWRFNFPQDFMPRGSVAAVIDDVLLERMTLDEIAAAVTNDDEAGPGVKP
jgi:hypothetical protein